MDNRVLTTIKDYHQQTKHQPMRYARAPGYMDWANQPLPYRLYQGAAKIPLPFSELEADPYSALSEKTSKPAQPISLNTLANMLQHSLGLSAWKQYSGSEWALRINPSSGNLHPTECYLLLPELEDQAASSVHYNPYINSLEQLAELPQSTAQLLNNQQGFAIVLTSIAWREAWKYGERAYRYCQHDLGHALAALNIACNLNGWNLQLMPEIKAQNAQKLLGLTDLSNEAEKEWSECVCWVSKIETDTTEISAQLNVSTELSHQHQANQLSAEHTDWPIINNLFKSLHDLPLPAAETKMQYQIAETQGLSSAISTQEIIQQRRSAQRFDTNNSQIELAVFLQQLQKTLSSNAVPFDALPYAPQVHLCIFVFNVIGLTPGLYLWCRNDSHLPLLKAQMSDNFSWTQAIDNQPLYLLEAGNFKARAKIISCSQDIASDGAYSLGMLAQFSELLAKNPTRYPLLFWETGLIGQVLYLQAEAFSLRGTGIGCFFDDEMHTLLGLKDDNWQILYHFTVGHAIEDKRLQTKPAYFHLK